MQTGSGDKPIRPSKPKTPKPKRTVVKAPAGDIASSGGDYGTKQADRYKKTKEYRGAVREGYKGSQNRRRTLDDNAKTAQRRGGASPEQAVAIKTHLDATAGNRKTARSQAGKDTKGNADRARAIKFLADNPEILKPKKKDDGGLLGAVGDVVHTVFPKGGKGQGTGSAATSSIPMVSTGGPAIRARNIGLALASDPVAVGKNTVKSVPQIAAGTVGAIGSIANDTVHGRTDTLGKLPGAAAKDYQRRYGSSTADQIKQIKDEGIASDIADATAVVGGAGAAVGRALTPLAKAGALGKAAEKVATEARPKLRVTPGEGGAKVQDKSPNLIVAAGQQMRDRSRAKATANKVAKHEQKGTPIRGMVPQAPGEVVRRSRTRQRIDQRKGVANDVARGFIRLKNQQNREVRGGINTERAAVRKATPKKQRAVVADTEQLALEGHINFDDAAKTRELLTKRRAQIVKNRGTGKKAKKVPLQRATSNDDLARVDRVLAALDADPASVLSPALKDFHAKQVDRHGRLQAQDQIVDPLTSDVRRFMPLARTTGDAKALEDKIARIEAEYQVSEARGRTLYHGSPHGPDVVTKHGLKGSEPELASGAKDRHGVYLSGAARTAQAYGRHMYAVDEKALRNLTADKHGGPGAFHTPHDIPPGALRYIGKGGQWDENLIREIEAGKHGKSISAEEAQQMIHDARVEFVKRMKAKVAKEGLSDPVYVLHRARPTAGYSDYAAGGSRAVAGVKKSNYKLHDTGTQDVTPGAYTQGVAKSIKRNVNWNTVSDILERNAADWSRGAGGGRKIESLRKELDARGLDERDWAVVDLGVYRKHLESSSTVRGDDLARDGEAGLHDALAHATHDLTGAEAKFVRTNRRFVVVPRAVANELGDMTKPAGTIRRSIQKFQGLQSRILLNYNPTFVPIQVVANTPLALFAMRGNVKDLVAAQRWYKKLDPQSQDAVNEFLGISAGQSANMSPRMGAAAPDNRLVRGYQALVDSDKAQAVNHSRWNPKNWNPLLDDAQNTFFRKAVFYNDAKRKAATGMGRSARAIEGEAKPLMDILKMPAGEEKIRLLRQAEPQFEKIAAHTDEWLGNYLRYTATERQYMKTALLFYGFLRWSVKFTFYTLPVKHPIATSLMAKLGQLQNEEVIDLLSMQAVQESGGKVTQEEAAATLRGGGFADAFGRVYITSDGKLKSIDLARVNPFTSTLTDVMGGGLRALPGLLSPAVQAAFDVAYGRSAFQDRQLVMDGSPVQHAKDITLGGGARYLLRTEARTAAPIRIADNVLNPNAQGDDSLPILGDRPRNYKTAQGQASAAKRLEQKGGTGRRLGTELLPLRSKPDNTAVGVSIAAQADKKKNKAKPGAPALPPGVSQAEFDSLVSEAQKTAAQPQVSDAELQQLLKEQGAPAKLPPLPRVK